MGRTSNNQASCTITAQNTQGEKSNAVFSFENIVKLKPKTVTWLPRDYCVSSALKKPVVATSRILRLYNSLVLSTRY